MSGKPWLALALSAILHGAVLGVALMVSHGSSPDIAAPTAIAVELVTEHPPETAAGTAPPAPTAPPVAAASPPTAASSWVEPIPPRAASAAEPTRRPAKPRPRRIEKTPMAVLAPVVASASPEPEAAPRIEAQDTGPTAPPPATTEASATAFATTPARASAPAAAPKSPPGADYLRTLVAWLERYKTYPEDARLRREQGTVLVAFVIGRDGHVQSFGIRSGSGSASLDRAAEDMIERADPLPPLPDSYAAGQLSMSLPVTFALR